SRSPHPTLFPSRPLFRSRMDGMPACLGDLEPTLKVRSRIGLVLAAIAIGAAGAGVYLGLTAKDQSASNSDVSALHDDLDKTKARSEEHTSALQSLAYLVC